MTSLTSDFCLLSHGHIDHSAGIAYYLSQRFPTGDVFGDGARARRRLPGVDFENHTRRGRRSERKVTEHRIVADERGGWVCCARGADRAGVCDAARCHRSGFRLLTDAEKLKPEALEAESAGASIATRDAATQQGADHLHAGCAPGGVHGGYEAWERRCCGSGGDGCEGADTRSVRFL